MALGNFSATVDAWVQKSEKRMLAVFQQSAQKTASLAQERIPVDTGFARASVRASLSSMPPIESGKSNPGSGSVPYDPGSITAVIAGAKLGQTIYIGWTANYVGLLEMGHSKQAPSGFVRLAAMQWQQTVADAVQQAKARAA